MATSPPRYRRSVYFPEIPDLFFSYGTCGGSLLQWEGFEDTIASSSRVLTAVIPSITYVPYHYKVDSATNTPFESHDESAYQLDAIPYSGILAEYLRELQTASYSRAPPEGFQMTWVSRPSRAERSSSWTAAVEDVGGGIADFGLSLFWMTPERLQISSFTSSIATDLLYLFVPAPTVDNSLLTQMAAPFEPFTWQVWVAVVMVVVISGSLQTMLTQRLWWDEWTKRVGYDGASARMKPVLLLERFAESTYETFVTMVNGGPEFHEEHRLATRLLNIGVGLFACILISAYTANLAAFLGRRRASEAWGSIDDVTNAGSTVCAHVILQSTLRRAYPSSNFVFRFMDSASDIRAALTSDGCRAFVAATRDMAVGGEMDAVRCEFGFVRTGTPVAELDVALPAQAQVADALSYWMNSLAAQEGVTYARVQARHEVEPRCPMTGDPDAQEELFSLTLSNFSAPLALVVLCCALAIATRMTRNASHVVDDVVHSKMTRAKSHNWWARRFIRRLSQQVSETQALEADHTAASEPVPATREPLAGPENDRGQSTLDAIEQHMRTIADQLATLKKAKEAANYEA